MRIEEFGIGDLLSLLREWRAEDEQVARLIEAYLDRVGMMRSLPTPPVLVAQHQPGVP
jgi:hypothetical protein